jgi:hypothetical protein
MSEQDIRKEGDKWILETMVNGMEGVGRFVIGLDHQIPAARYAAAIAA